MDQCRAQLRGIAHARHNASQAKHHEHVVRSASAKSFRQNQSFVSGESGSGERIATGFARGLSGAVAQRTSIVRFAELSRESDAIAGKRGVTFRAVRSAVGGYGSLLLLPVLQFMDGSEHGRRF